MQPGPPDSGRPEPGRLARSDSPVKQPSTDSLGLILRAPEGRVSKDGAALVLRDASLRDAPQSLTRKGCAFSSPCETAGEELHAGNSDPGLGAADGSFKILGEAAVASQPWKRRVDDPGAWS